MSKIGNIFMKKIMKMKTYRVPVLGFINTEIRVQANSIEEAIKLTYKEMDEDTSRFHPKFHYDTIEADVEEVDEIGELIELRISQLMGDYCDTYQLDADGNISAHFCKIAHKKKFDEVVNLTHQSFNREVA